MSFHRADPAQSRAGQQGFHGPKRGDGRVVERVLSEAEPTWEIRDGASARASAPVAGTSFTRYVALGVEHILSGWDHLAFVIALLLLASTLREVAGLVTGFTVAHSVTTSAPSYDWGACFLRATARTNPMYFP